MSGEPDRRQPSDFDRVFAEMTADWQLETGRPGVPDEAPERPDGSGRLDGTEQPHGPGRPTPAPDHPRSRPVEPSEAWAEDHPLFRSSPGSPAAPEPPPEPDDFERPTPEPIPWRSLSTVAVTGGLLLAFSVVVLLMALFGVPFPRQVALLAVGSFVAGFLLLMTRLRRASDDDGSDGARL